MKIIRNERGQSAVEYALLITAVVAALVAGQWFIKNAMSGRLKESATSIGSQWDFDQGRSHREVHSNSDRREVATPAGSSTTTINDERQRQDTNETITRNTQLFSN